jgi:hypothetical protein
MFQQPHLEMSTLTNHCLCFATSRVFGLARVLAGMVYGLVNHPAEQTVSIDEY